MAGFSSGAFYENINFLLQNYANLWELVLLLAN